MKVAKFRPEVAENRPEGAGYLAQGKRRNVFLAAPPWVQESVTKSSRPAGARYCTVLSLALTGRQVGGKGIVTQGGGEYALPWAGYQAPAGRKFDQTCYFDATVSIEKTIFHPF